MVNPSALVAAGGLSFLSAGRTAWALVDLPPGTYVALCYVPDREVGAPHALMGMIDVFSVGGGAAAEAAPATPVQ
jgi:hypothetical protein